MGKRHGVSYQKRVHDINEIYDRHSRSGLSNREIWRRFIYPVYAVSERSFYNILKASGMAENEVPHDVQLFFEFNDDDSFDNDGE